MNKSPIIIIAIIAVYSFPAIAELPHIDIEHNISPTEIWVSDLKNNPYPESAIVTLKVTGDGDPYSIIRPIDIVFAIDSSGSMGGNDPDGHRIIAAQEFVDKMNPYKDRVGMVSWNDDVVFDLPLTDDFSRVKRTIAAVDAGGGTDLNNGLARSIDHLIQQTRKSTKVIIFLSDGDGDYTLSGMDGSETDRARSAGILIYSIGLGNDSNEANLEDMADMTGGRYFFSPESTFLEDIYQNIFKRISNIAAKNIEVTYILPASIQPSESMAGESFNDNGNRVLKWTIGQMAIGENRDISFYVKSADAGTFTLGADSTAEYTNSNEEPATLNIMPTTLLVKLPIKVGGRIWVDKNGNGTQDPDENGKGGLAVALLDREKKPTGRTAITDFNGSYQFSIFQKGTYYIQMAIPVGYILSPQNLNINTEINCDFGSDGISNQVYLADPSNFSIDAGLIPNDCISGRVWIDTNKNGWQDNGEIGYNNASVALLDAIESSVGSMNFTDSNGIYHFDKLEPGIYYIRFKAPNGSILSLKMLSDEQEENIYPGSYGISRPVVLTDGCDRGVDMAIIPLCRNSIYLKDISGEDLEDYPAMIRLYGENFPVVPEDEDVHIFISDSDGRPLSYWIEEWNATAKIARIWIKMPLIPASNETEILMQYYSENSSDNITKNPQGIGSYVFEFFDDFNDNALDKEIWTARTDANGSIVEQDGQLQIHTNARSISSADLTLNESFGSGMAMKFRADISTGQSYDRKGLGFMNTNVGEDTNSIGSSVYWRAQDRDIFAHHIIPIFEKNNPDVKFLRAKSNYEGGFSTWEIKWLDSRIFYALDSQSFVHDIEGKPMVEISPRFSLNTTLTSLSSNILVDWVLIRRCIEREPTARFGQRICMNKEDLHNE